MSVTGASPGSSRAASGLDFATAVEQRRGKVYDFLDRWAGATAFQPEDIHEAIYSYISRKGKALRPVVLLLSCGAVGGDENQALPAAAAVEVFHTWTLVHDDIIDRDDTRRGRPTVHAQYRAHAADIHHLDPEAAGHYGQAVAILAGDLQQSWAYALLGVLPERGVAPEVVLETMQRMANWLTPSLLEGEMLDVQYSLTPFEELSEEQVLNMLTKKTGALLEYSAWCGAKIGLANRADTHGWADKLGRFASLCGTAFQLHDDLLGLTAEEALLGKPVGSDIREGKRTLIVYRALRHSTPAGRRAILSALGNHGADGSMIAEALSAIHSSGAADEVRELANSYISQADAILIELPPSEYRDLLAAWAAFLLARTH